MDLDPKETAGWLGAFVAAILGGLGIRLSRKQRPIADRMQRQIDTLRERLDRHIDEDVLAHERIAVLEALTGARKPRT